MGLKAMLPSYELGFYALVVTCAVVYSGSGIFEASRGNAPQRTPRRGFWEGGWVSGGCFYSAGYQQRIPGSDFHREHLGNPPQGSFCLVVPSSPFPWLRSRGCDMSQLCSPCPKQATTPACTGLVPRFFLWKPQTLKISWVQLRIPGMRALKRLRWKLRFAPPRVDHEALWGRGV